MFLRSQVPGPAEASAAMGAKPSSPLGPVTPTQAAKKQARRAGDNLLLDLPDEILSHIVRQVLDVRDLCALSCCSARLDRLVQEVGGVKK